MVIFKASRLEACPCDQVILLAFEINGICLILNVKLAFVEGMSFFLNVTNVIVHSVGKTITSSR